MNTNIFKPIDDLLADMEAECIKEIVQTQKEIAQTKKELAKLEKNNCIVSAVFIVILFAAIIFLLSITNSPKRLIGMSLTAAGYSVDSLTVEKTDINGVYKASSFAVSEDGQLIELWTIKPVPGFKTISRAEPYPTQPIRKYETINLSLDPVEHEQLLLLAQQNGESVEDYIKRQIFQRDTA